LPEKVLLLIVRFVVVVVEVVWPFFDVVVVVAVPAL
jgi:hypothetical protein